MSDQPSWLEKVVVSQLNPTELPPDTVFVLEAPMKLTASQASRLRDFWEVADNPLREHKLIILDAGLKLIPYVPASKRSKK